VSQASRPLSDARPRIVALPHRYAAESAETAGAVLRFGTVALLAAAPFAFGATSVQATVLLIAVSWALLLGWLAAGIRRGAIELPAHPVALPALLLLAFTAVHWVARISPAPYATQLEWLRWAGCLALACVAVAVFDSESAERKMLGAFAVAGAMVALLGIAQHLSGTSRIYWTVEPPAGGWIFGPYVNRNHFAGLMELWMPGALVLALRPRASFLERAFWGVLGGVMCAGVVLSGSRGGLLAVAVELLALAVGVALLRGGRRGVAVLLLVVLLAGAAFYFAGRNGMPERLVSSFEPRAAFDSEVAGNRIAAWRDTLRLFSAQWLYGSGLDSFGVLFPGVRSFATDKFWSHAHNDFLQFLAETGVIGAALALWMLAAGACAALRRMRLERDAESGPLALALACACLGFMLHGWFDFGFHVSANAASFAVLAALLTRSGEAGA
jgi:O-antigen ligase